MIGHFTPSRRQLLLGSGALFAWAHLPNIALAEGRDPRFLAIILRGALDGLAAVVPVGDPDWERVRGDAPLPGAQPSFLPLDGFFALNPSMPNLHRLYHVGQASFVHAVATPYRGRSHFEGQDVLESGLPRPSLVDSGWLNRSLARLSPADRVALPGRSGFTIGPVPPLVIRGQAPLISWSPPVVAPASDDALARLLDLYRHSDLELAEALEERIGLAAMVGAAPARSSRMRDPNRIARPDAFFAECASAAAKVLARADGPRIGAMAFDGWDTHGNQGSVTGKLATLLQALDGAVAAIETGMGQAWRETVVIVVTEFGRTARINGTKGTDHGTATVAFLAGGALKGGRVVADWPGLAEADLHDGRDLAPTTDLRAVLKGLLKDHLRVTETDLASVIFPGSEDVQPMAGLLA
jgi:uncharacterized protein (DUF1501 family)